MNAPKRSLAPRIRPASPETAPVLAIQTGRPVDASVAERRREERLLVDAVLAGEPDAFARLYTLYAPDSIASPSVGSGAMRPRPRTWCRTSSSRCIAASAPGRRLALLT
ncbi:MAG: hypothetical protein R3E53_05430 [Myxococcota bacterium]